MKKLLMLGVGASAALTSSFLFGGSVYRSLGAEMDTVAPVSAAYESSQGTPTSKWGGGADFNIRGNLSTGPDVWIGDITKNGPDSSTTHVPRDAFQYGEQQKIDAIRLEWTLTKWEIAETMRGWYVKAGYSYTRITSKANRYTDQTINLQDYDPMSQSDYITDTRHGAVLGLGERWTFIDQHCSVTLGSSITAIFKRTIDHDGNNPDAVDDYKTLIEELPETRLSARMAPEVHMNIGYLW